MIVVMVGVASESLTAAVRAAIGRPTADLGEHRRTHLEYDAFLANRSVVRIHGDAIDRGDSVSWSLIEKRTEGPGLASPYLLDNGLREYDAYRSGLLDDMPHGIRAPRAYGTLLEPDGAVTLWLEEVHQEGPRPLDASALLAVARNLGEMNGRWFDREPDEPWLFTGWIDRHAQPEAVEQGLATLRRAHPAALNRLGGRVAIAERLILEQPRIRAILQSLPQTICHHDAVGANVFSTETGTVLIDWESVGPGTVGADLASLLFASVRRGDASAHTVAPILGDAVESYADGFRSESSGVSVDEIRRGFDAAIALRWKHAVDVTAGLEKAEPARRGSRPHESSQEAEEELLLLVDVLLASFRETR